MNTGIYLITTPSGKQYVGSAVNFIRRWTNHRNELIAGTHHNKPLLSAFMKYGMAGLTFEKLIVCEKKDLLLYEQIAIDTLNPRLNVLRIAGSALGMKLTLEAREKIRFAASHISAETSARRSAAQTGRVMPAATREKISKAKAGVQGKPHTPERIENQRLGSRKGHNPPAFEEYDPWLENFSREKLQISEW